MRQFVIYCDESKKRGRYFSNFYGGALLEESNRILISSRLENLKRELNLYNELKWTRITENYASKYIEFVREFFKFVKNGSVKVRVMFTQNRIVPVNLTDEQFNNEYFLLYYQFLKHAFGLQFAEGYGGEVSTYLDQLPHNAVKNDEFKDYIASLSNFPPLRSKGIVFSRDRISDVDSKDHVILQALDIVLGSMQFRLNDHHLDKPDGSRLRAKRTRAKERVFKTISEEVRDIYPNFNIGVSTGKPNGHADRWQHQYRHWLFMPSEVEIDHAAPIKKRRAPR